MPIKLSLLVNGQPIISQNTFMVLNSIYAGIKRVKSQPLEAIAFFLLKVPSGAGFMVWLRSYTTLTTGVPTKTEEK